MRLHGNLIMAISRRPWRLYRAPWRSYGVLVGDCLRSHGAHYYYYYYYYYYGLKNVCLHISVHLYYFVWLVLCDICAPTAILQRCRRPYYAATATSRRSHDCAFTGQHSHGVCFEHVQSARRRSAFYATSSRSLAMPGVACVITARRSAFCVVLERRGNAVLVWQLH